MSNKVGVISMAVSAVASAAALTLLSLATPASAKLSTTYYRETCPKAEQIVSDVVTGKQISSPTTAAGTLRLFFHDCFVGGCDASVLISTNAFNRAERDADDNISLPGDAFDIVTRAKTALELQCPGVVSCADVLALATRDLVLMLGGPSYAVRLGRKDALASTAAAVPGNLPSPDMTMDQLIDVFTKNKMTVQDMVALSGAHTVGFSHCNQFASRIIVAKFPFRWVEFGKVRGGAAERMRELRGGPNHRSLQRRDDAGEVRQHVLPERAAGAGSAGLRRGAGGGRADAAAGGALRRQPDRLLRRFHQRHGEAQPRRGQDGQEGRNPPPLRRVQQPLLLISLIDLPSSPAHG